MRVKRTERGRIKITCTPAQATAIICLLNTSCTYSAIQRIFPKARLKSPWEAFKKAGISTDIHLPVECQVAPQLPAAYSPSVQLTHAFGEYFKIKPGYEVAMLKKIKPYFNWRRKR